MKAEEFGILDVVEIKEEVNRSASGRFIPNWVKGKKMRVQGFSGDGKVIVTTFEEEGFTGVFFETDLALIQKNSHDRTTAEEEELPADCCKESETKSTKTLIQRVLEKIAYFFKAFARTL